MDNELDQYSDLLEPIEQENPLDFMPDPAEYTDIIQIQETISINSIPFL